MNDLFHARSIDPNAVTAEDLAAILAEHKVRTDEPGPADFFQPGVTYRRNHEFRCLAVGWSVAGRPVALGLLPINLDGKRTWEFGYMIPWDWRRGWTAVDAAAAETPTDTEVGTVVYGLLADLGKRARGAGAATIPASGEGGS